jgi:hypothetical protein
MLNETALVTAETTPEYATNVLPAFGVACKDTTSPLWKAFALQPEVDVGDTVTEPTPSPTCMRVNGQHVVKVAVTLATLPDAAWETEATQRERERERERDAY